MDMRTPLNKVRGLGSAKDGTEHFWRQRLTAVANIPLILFLVIFIIVYNGENYETVAGAFANPLVSVLFALTVISALAHMRIGMQVIIEDYVHAEVPKAFLLMLNTFFTFAVAATVLLAVLKLSFGA